MRYLIHFLFYFYVNTIDAYNVDKLNAKIIKDPNFNKSPNRSSYFGYSVALYATNDINDSLVLIGAPRANSTRQGDRKVIEPGAVYRCSLGKNVQCSEWLLDDSKDNDIFWDEKHQQKRDNAWLGATIKVENSTTPRVVVCAPRWIFRNLHYLNEPWYMNGMCYTIRAKDSNAFNTDNATRNFPLLDNDKQIIEYRGNVLYNYGVGMAGFSAHFRPDNLDLVIGAPGIFHWTGSPLKITVDGKRHNNFLSVTPNIIDKTDELKFDDYFGYSVTSGYFNKKGERLYAAGAPRGSDGLGKVFKFSFTENDESKISIHGIINGEQTGEYFGSSLASCDINNDGRDDLIAGAPQWSKYTDEGRIYAYISGSQNDVVQRIDGINPSARFGTSLTCLGDLDYDGYADVAVGAPYEDEKGAIYIYNGGVDGLNEKHVQLIHADHISSSLRGFGISISDPRDIDGNKYADIAVGAYLSGHAVVLKTRPAVTLTAKVLKPANFTLMQNSTNFVVDICLQYDGAFAPETFTVLYKLTIDQSHKRVIVYQNGRLFGNIFRASKTLKKGEYQCIPVKINLKKNVLNVIDPIEIVASVTSDENPSCLKCPDINPTYSQTTDSLKLVYVLDCGEDELCVSDLRLNITSNLDPDERYVIGSTSHVNMSIFVYNIKEAAYGTQAHVYIPEPIVLAKVPPECDEQSLLNKTLEIICSIGNPLRYNSTLNMELDMSGIQYTDDYKEIQVLITTQSEEKNYFDNFGSLRIDNDIDADIEIVGKSYDELYSYFEKDINFKNFTFNHVYEILKFGITPIEEAILMINIPTGWKNIEIAKINQMQGSLNGKQCVCENMSNAESKSSLFLSDNEFLNKTNDPSIISSESQAFSMNCADKDVACDKFFCKLGPFAREQSVAQLSVKIDFQLSNISTEALEGRDVIFFVSEAFVRIMQPNVTIEKANKRPDYKQITTKFLRYHEPLEVALWIIILSVLLGIVLLTLLSYILYKLGFFNRKQKENLDTLRAKEGINDETTVRDNNTTDTPTEKDIEEL